MFRGCRFAYLLTRPIGDQFRLPYLLEVRPAVEFSYDAARSRLINLAVGTQAGPGFTFVVPGDILAGDGLEEGEGFAGRQAALLQLSGCVDVDSVMTVCRNTFDFSSDTDDRRWAARVLSLPTFSVAERRHSYPGTRRHAPCFVYLQ